MPGHNVPMVVLGTFILAFGWFGFNPGSTLAGTDLRISFVVVNTMLASITGASPRWWRCMLKGLKPDPTMMCNGMLAGLVAITAPCAFVDPWAAAVIGAIAGVLVVVSVFFFEERGVDDPVGAISVHGVNGLWGVLSVGIFATGQYGAGWNGVVRDAMVKAYGSDGVRGLLYGDFSQFVMQAIDCVVLCGLRLRMAYVWFKVSDLITPIRVTRRSSSKGSTAPRWARSATRTSRSIRRGSGWRDRRGKVQRAATGRRGNPPARRAFGETLMTRVPPVPRRRDFGARRG